MDDPFESALQKAMMARGLALEDRLASLVRVVATDAMPEGEIRIVDLTGSHRWEINAGNGVTEHWVQLRGRKRVMFARSGVEVEGATMRFWVADTEQR